MLRTREVLIASSNCPWTEWFEKSFPRAFESEFCHLWPSLLKDARFSCLKDIKVISWSPFTDNIFSFYVLFNIWIMFTHCNCEFQSHPTSLMFQATSDLTTKLSYPALVVLWFISKLIGFHVKCFWKIPSLIQLYSTEHVLTSKQNIKWFKCISFAAICSSKWVDREGKESRT